MPPQVSLLGETMSRKTILAIPGALLLCGGLFYFYGGHHAPQGQTPLTDITPESLADLESAFNAANHDVRLLILLSPT